MINIRGAGVHAREHSFHPSKWRVKALTCFPFLILLVFTFPVHASDFQIEKQKVKLSMEYESLMDLIGDEIHTTGVKATYLFKGQTDTAKRIFWNFDLQTGLKTYLDRSFHAGELSPWTWSNRASVQGTVPLGRFFAGGSFHFRNKWLADVPAGHEFVDVFGGEGFREITGSLQGGCALSKRWNLSGSFQHTDLNFDHFELSNSNSKGGSASLARNFERFKVGFDYRYRSIDSNRPVLTVNGPIVSPEASGKDFLLQHDHFQEAGVTIEFSHPFYISAGYFYQDNNSNNPGFSYTNHVVRILIGTDLTHDLSFQAYGILQSQTFQQQDAFLPFPVFLEDNSDNNTMAASLTKNVGSSTEIELGIQRLNHNSSFEELNASKTILYAAYNYRW